MLARGMRPATYVSVLLRSHLRSPEVSLHCRRTSSWNSGVPFPSWDLHRIVHTLAQEGRAAAKGQQPDLQAVVRLCQALRSDTKALIQANVNSWEIGRPVNGAASRHPTRQ